jgi:uncharacterized protein
MEYFKNKEINSLSLLTTLRCNLKCKYCYINQKEEDMSFDTLKKALDLFLNSSGLNKRIIFVGGEPLLNYPLIKSAVDYINQLKINSKKKMITILNTNGTIMNEEIFELFKTIDFISISLDGVKETQDKNRLFKDDSSSFESILKNINYLKEHFNTKFLLNKVITSGNYETFQEDLLFLISLEPFFINLNVALGDEGWNEEKFKDFFKIVQSSFEKIKIEPEIERKFKNMFEDFSNECVFSYIVCSPSGGIYPCEILFSLNKGSIGSIENINKDILECSYSPKNERCSKQLCRECGNICKKVSFKYGKLSENVSDESFLWLKNAHTFQSIFKKLKNGTKIFYEDANESLRII